MGELSINEKAKRYNEALEIAKKNYVTSQELCEGSTIGVECFKNTLEKIFPELKENEDEKIRKELLEHCKNQAKPYIQTGNKCPQIQSWIDWLEKQNRKETTFNKEDEENMNNVLYILNQPNDNEDEEMIKWIIDDIRYNMDNEPLNNSEYKKKAEKAIAWLEKQGEQKKSYDTCDSCMMDNKKSPYSEKRDFGYFEEISADNANSVFHEGDWITIDNPCQIISINDNGNYIVRYCDDETTHVLSKKFCESHYHLWTIEDAKGGDVLVCKGDIKYSNGVKYERICLFKDLNSAFFTFTKTSDCIETYSGNVHIDYLDNTVPATKEQRDLLFKKMKEAGYEWDADNKELKIADWGKHIKYNPKTPSITKEKLTWSKEDDRIYYSLLADIRIRQDGSTNMLEAYYNEQIEWLKSLKEKIGG